MSVIIDCEGATIVTDNAGLPVGAMCPVAVGTPPLPDTGSQPALAAGAMAGLVLGVLLVRLARR